MVHPSLVKRNLAQWRDSSRRSAHHALAAMPRRTCRRSHQHRRTAQSGLGWSCCLAGLGLPGSNLASPPPRRRPPAAQIHRDSPAARISHGGDGQSIRGRVDSARSLCSNFHRLALDIRRSCIWPEAQGRFSWVGLSGGRLGCRRCDLSADRGRLRAPRQTCERE